MSEFPADWDIKNIGNFASRVRRKNTGGKCLNPMTISAVDGLVSQRDYFNKIVASKNTEGYTLLHKNDFAYNKSYSDGYPVGAVRRLKAKDRGIVSPLYICFELDTGQIDLQFADYLFDSDWFVQAIYGIAKEGARSHGLLNIGIEEFFSAFLPIPPLPEQKKIAEILFGIDKTIEIHQQKIEDLSALLRELLSEHYQERCRNGDLQLEKVIRLPIQYGANASATELRSGEPRYIRITDIKEDGALNELNAVGIDLPANDCNNYLLREGDLLLARTGNTIGKSYLHKRTNEELVFAGYLLRVALDQKAYRPEYLFLFTQSDIYKNWISETSRTGAQPNINAKEYGAMPIPYSSISEQDAFIGRAMSLRRSKSILRNKIDKLKMLKQAISADLLSGRKRVSI